MRASHLLCSLVPRKRRESSGSSARGRHTGQGLPKKRCRPQHRGGGGGEIREAKGMSARGRISSRRAGCTQVSCVAGGCAFVEDVLFYDGELEELLSAVSDVERAICSTPIGCFPGTQLFAPSVSSCCLFINNNVHLVNGQSTPTDQQCLSRTARIKMIRCHDPLVRVTVVHGVAQDQCNAPSSTCKNPVAGEQVSLTSKYTATWRPYDVCADGCLAVFTSWCFDTHLKRLYLAPHLSHC